MKKIVAGFLMCLTPIAAWAESDSESQMYISTTAYAGTLDTGISSVTGGSLDEDDTAFSINLGYYVSPKLAIEGFYIDGGEASLKGDNGDTFVLDGTTYTFTANNVVIKSEFTAWGLNAKYDFAKTENLTVYGKAGFASWEADFTVAASSVSSTLAKDDGTDSVFALGVDYSLSDNVLVRTEYNKVEDWTGFGVGLVFLLD
ncbi:outer membrane beta-barrel protein [Litoricolaceae bacterium]|nr:outer membrane beta-barrel protein [Litorivicinaceae bacterium]